MPLADVTVAGQISTLTIPNVKKFNAYATYRCVVTNAAGRAESNPTTLAVTDSLIDRTALRASVRAGSSLVAAGARATAAAVTPPQTVTVNAGSRGHPWTAAPNQPWITIAGGSGDGVGQFAVGIDPAFAPVSGTVTGTVTVTESSFPMTQVLTVTLSVLSSSIAPIGSFDTPADGATGLAGSVALTGWALDDVGVNRVELWRSCIDTIDRPAGQCAAVGNSGPPNFVFVGNPSFVADARPDVEAAIPALPMANRAGWGYLLLTNVLPHVPLGQGVGGQGTFTLYAHAVDQEGQYTSLGAKTVTLDNANATTPFGAIDTPSQGGTVTTNVSVNFGWAMARGTRCIDTTSTSAYQVVIDGVPRTLRPNGSATNWVPGLSRTNLVASFPALCNTTTALAAYYIDASELGLGPGVHTIAWLVTDTAGHASGIGSRFFSLAVGASQMTSNVMAEAGRQTAAERPAAPRPRPSSGRVSAMVGFGEERFSLVPPGTEIELPATQRLVLDLDGAVEDGNQQVLGALRPLPAGSTLEAAAGRFYWQPPVGFLGRFTLIFRVGDDRIEVNVRLVDPSGR